jgi:hypothetical protein
MPSPKTRRYSIEIKDPNNKSVLFTAVDWTDEERLIAVEGVSVVTRWRPTLSASGLAWSRLLRFRRCLPVHAFHGP